MRLSPLEPWFGQFPLAPLRANAVLRFEDLSLRPRFGCKGPGAERWLAAAGYRVPPEPNSAAIDADGVLGRSHVEGPSQQRRRDLVSRPGGHAERDQRPHRDLEQTRSNRMTRGGWRGRPSAMVVSQHEQERRQREVAYKATNASNQDHNQPASPHTAVRTKARKERANQFGGSQSPTVPQRQTPMDRR